MATRGRPVVNKKRQRMNSPFLTKAVEDINKQIFKEYGTPTNKDAFWGTYKKINSADAEACFQQYKGKCVYCDKRLSYLGRRSIYAARLMWYVPLSVGGEARPDNLIVVCAECEHDYRDTRKLRRDVEGLDSFADTCEALFIAVRDGKSEEVRDQLKNRLNLRLVDIAACMRYVITSDWEPEELEIIQEGRNTIGERLDHMAKGVDVKDKVTNDVKQIVKTGQYRIIRTTTDE
jgi:hypothetical protein